MKILHTADWHIGKKLHKQELLEDFELFIQWLVNYIKDQQIDVVLVSGDVFDLANPSSEARRQYFQALLALRQLNCKVILTGGNHDSPAVLNGPRALLEAMDIHVVGNLPTKASDCLVPLYSADGTVEAVVAALPYLRDADLRKAGEVVQYEDRIKALREGVAAVFEWAAKACAEQYPGVPALAMGHLFAAGVSTSESERDIQIGNQASIGADAFGDYFKYVALGHIHKPQQVQANVPAYYSGSPLSLSFSERKDQKRVLVIDTRHFSVESVPLPQFRTLRALRGTLAELGAQLSQLTKKGPLKTLVELNLEEEHFDPVKLEGLDALAREYSTQDLAIVKQRAHFEQQISKSGELFAASQQLEDLKPTDVFDRLLEKSNWEDETKQLVQLAFAEVLEEVLQEESYED